MDSTRWTPWMVVLLLAGCGLSLSPVLLDASGMAQVDPRAYLLTAPAAVVLTIPFAVVGGAAVLLLFALPIALAPRPMRHSWRFMMFDDLDPIRAHAPRFLRWNVEKWRATVGALLVGGFWGWVGGLIAWVGWLSATHGVDRVHAAVAAGASWLGLVTGIVAWLTWLEDTRAR